MKPRASTVAKSTGKPVALAPVEVFQILLTHEAKEQYARLQTDKGLEKRYKAVQKTIHFLKRNPRHPGLQTHKFTSLKGPKGEEVFESYAEQNTPAAYRIFWYYGPEQNQITVIAITSQHQMPRALPVD